MATNIKPVKPRASKKDFTSVSQLLEEAGHRRMRMVDGTACHAIFGTRGEMSWFPNLKIIIHDGNNDCYQITHDDQRGWYTRKNQANSWNRISTPAASEALTLFMYTHLDKIIAED